MGCRGQRFAHFCLPSKQSTSADIFPPHAHQRERSDKVGIPSAYIEVGMPAIYDVG